MRQKIDNILIAIDFSEPALNALNTAVAIAEKTGASLFIVHAQDTVLEFIGISITNKERRRNNSENILTAMVNDISRKSSVQCMLIEEEGHASEIILRNAVKHDCDLIIVGTYGASGYKNGYIGSTTYNVIKFATCPVLVIPPDKAWTSFRQPLFPIRPLTTAVQHYDFIRNLLEPQSQLRVLCLSSSGEQKKINDLNELIAEIQKKLTEDKVSADIQWNQVSSIPQTVLMYADRDNSDLIVITPIIDISSKQFYVGPNAHTIIYCAKVPTLIINRVNTNVFEKRRS